MYLGFARGLFAILAIFSTGRRTSLESHFPSRNINGEESIVAIRTAKKLSSLINAAVEEAITPQTQLKTTITATASQIRPFSETGMRSVECRGIPLIESESLFQSLRVQKQRGVGLFDRIRIVVAGDLTDAVGWQRNPNVIAVAVQYDKLQTCRNGH